MLTKIKEVNYRYYKMTLAKCTFQRSADLIGTMDEREIKLR